MDNILKKICIIFAITGFLLSQDYRSVLKLRYNSTNDSFWNLNNNGGKYIHDNEIAYEINFKKSKIEYKISITNAYKKNKKLSMGESFLKYSLSDKTFLRIGNYYRDYSLYLNDNLSAGHILISNNAPPIPKIGLVSSKKIKKNIELKLGMSHGWLKKENFYTKAPLLHEKFIYLNISKKNNLFSVGLAHAAMWGGAGPDYNNNEWEGYINFNHSVTLRNFLKVFISDDGKYQPPHANSLGNHLGIWDFSYQKKSFDKIFKAYYQHIFDDTSGLRFANKYDGLWGIELENYLPKMTIVLEYLSTSNALINPPYQLDYYYYNYEYRLGWSYKSHVLGNPFIYSGAGNPFYDPAKNFKEINVLNLAFSGELGSTYFLLKAAKDLNSDNQINYKILFGKNFFENLSLNASLFNSKEISLGLNYIF